MKMNQSSSQAAFAQAEEENTQTLNTIMVTEWHDIMQ